MYVCICAGVCEREIRGAIRDGARCEDSVGDRTLAGTGCGSCVERICELIKDETRRPSEVLLTG